jgi:hypothetical protein
MLIKNPSLVLGATFIAALWAGCTIKEVDPGTPIETTSNNSTTTVTVGSGGAGGEGTTVTTGVGGGGVDCVGDTGSTDTAAACDNLAIAPATAEGCGPNADEDTPGYGACVHSYDLWTQGSFDNFLACLDTISVQPAIACDVMPVGDCVDEVYDEACDRPEVAAVCDEFGTICAEQSDAFNVQDCKDDLRPFSDAGLEIYAECINAHVADPCQAAHDFCFNDIQ